MMINVYQKLQRLALVVLTFVSLSGCVLVPFVQAFKETGLTEGDRMALLPPQVKKFSDARVFGNKRDALDLVAPESRAEISKQLQSAGPQERVVKSQIDEIEWLENAYKARVVIKVDSFTMNQLIVKTTTEEQKWEFKTGDGWVMISRSKSEVG
jgi:hypothetical protein